MSAKRRKDDVECSVFQECWTEKYFFVQHFGKPVCLICQGSVAVFKEFNIKRHYEANHSKYAELTGQLRKDEIAKLSRSLQKQTLVFKKQNSECEKNTLASFAVSKLVAEEMKPFTDGVFVKKCLMTVVDILCPEKKDLFSNVSLSARTVTRRIEEMSADLKSSLKRCCEEFQYFSIALDESTDATDTAQPAVFIRGVSETFEIVEQFLQLIPIKGTTKGEDILVALLQCFSNLDLDLTKLVSVTTDGAPAMVGQNKGVIALLKKHLEGIGIVHEVRKIHCIINQEALCVKTSNLNEVMDVAVKAVNGILSRGLNHRQFRQLLTDSENEYKDLLYYCDVRWLSRGAMLERVYALREEIAGFLESKNMNAKEFRDHKWLSSLAFLVDLTKHLNSLNLQLQGKNQLIHEMWSHVTAFETKLRLWENQLEKSNYTHFPTLAERRPNESCDFVTVIRALKSEFASRFADLRSHVGDFRLFCTPFDIDVEKVADNIQMELIELQCNDILKAKFNACGVPLVDFYKKYLLEARIHRNLTNRAKRMVSMFGSTYVCEQLFSKMKHEKSSEKSGH